MFWFRSLLGCDLLRFVLTSLIRVLTSRSSCYAPYTYAYAPSSLMLYVFLLSHAYYDQIRDRHWCEYYYDFPAVEA
jgi:hypothetical protein